MYSVHTDKQIAIRLSTLSSLQLRQSNTSLYNCMFNRAQRQGLSFRLGQLPSTPNYCCSFEFGRPDLPSVLCQIYSSQIVQFGNISDVNGVPTIIIFTSLIEMSNYVNTLGTWNRDNNSLPLCQSDLDNQTLTEHGSTQHAKAKKVCKL